MDLAAHTVVIKSYVWKIAMNVLTSHLHPRQNRKIGQPKMWKYQEIYFYIAIPNFGLVVKIALLIFR
jgi:hypothetical protein